MRYVDYCAVAYKTEIIHSVVATAANVADSQIPGDLLHGKETRVWGDQAYRGQREVILAHAPHAADFTDRRTRHAGVIDEEVRARNRTRSRVRARVEHLIGVINSGFRGNDMRLRLPEGALPRPRQERLPPRRCPRPRQHLHTAPHADARRSGLKGRPAAADNPPSDRSSTSAHRQLP